MVFFVVSGYAISYKSLKLVRQGRLAEFGDALCSSVFRRHPRLFMPAAAVMFATAIMSQLQCFGVEGWEDVAVPSRVPYRPGNLTAQLTDWSVEVLHIADPISTDIYRGGGNSYDPNLWTLPIEFSCSLFVFLCLAAFARIRPLFRLGLTLSLALFAQHYNAWYLFLFTAGMFLCDLHFHLETPDAQPAAMTNDPESLLNAPLGPPRLFSLQHLPLFRRAAWTTSFIMALFVLSMPESTSLGPVTPGYRTLATIVPATYVNDPEHFWLPLAAAWLLLTVDRAPHLQAIFTHSFPQYLGRISFALYLVHGPLVWSFGRKAAMACVGLTGEETPVQYFSGIALSACVFWPVAIYVADLTWRVVDAKSVELGKRVYEWILVRPQEDEKAEQL
jgi:peptidoglycan/LPS O-acetylase OafA/YrhL